MDTEDPVLQTVRENFEVLSQDTLEKLNRQGTMGYAIERLDFGYFAFGEYISAHTLQVMRPMRQNIINGSVVAAIVRSWYLKDEFDEFILRIQQSGIQNYWLLDVTYRQESPSVQMALKVAMARTDGEKKAADAEPLRLDRMVGIFYMLAFGLALGTVVFMAELCQYKWTRASNLTAPAVPAQHSVNN